MRKLRITDPLLSLALQDEIRRNEDSKYDHRLHAVLLVSQGKTCYEVASLLGDSVRIVHGWVHRFEKEGFVGLRAKEKLGRPCLLKESELQEIDKVLRLSPRESGMSTNIWDGKTLSAWIKKNLNVTLRTRQCQRLFRQLKFRLRKPRPMLMHKNKNEVKREEFKKKRAKSS